MAAIEIAVHISPERAVIEIAAHIYREREVIEMAAHIYREMAVIEMAAKVVTDRHRAAHPKVPTIEQCQAIEAEISMLSPAPAKVQQAKVVETTATGISVMVQVVGMTDEMAEIGQACPRLAIVIVAANVTIGQDS